MRSAGTLGRSKGAATDVDGDGFVGSFGCRFDEREFVGGEVDGADEGAGVVALGSAGSWAHVSRVAEVWREVTFESSISGMTPTPSPLPVVASSTGTLHAYVTAYGLNRTICGRAVPKAHGWFGPIDRAADCTRCLRVLESKS